MSSLRLEAGAARLNPNERARSATCFFCGAEFTFQNGEQICCVKSDEPPLPSRLDKHVCPRCAGAEPDALQARLTKWVAGLRTAADHHRTEAAVLDSTADTLAALDVRSAARVWNPSLFNRA